MANVGVWSLAVKPPIWKSENEAGPAVFHSASPAAIFMGWYVLADDAELAAHQHGMKAAGPARGAPPWSSCERRATSERRSRCQADTASMSAGAGDERGEQHVGVPQRNTGW